MKVIIIGAGTAGIETAVQLRKLDSNCEIVIIDKRKEIGYSPCAMPFIVGREIKIEDTLLFDKQFFDDRNIKLKFEEVKKIDSKNNKVLCEKIQESYDYLVIATGARPFSPVINDLKEGDYLHFKTITDTKQILSLVGAKDIKNIAIIGAGCSGIELAYALKKQKKKICLIERSDRIMRRQFDADMHELIVEKLKTDKIDLKLNVTVNEFKKGNLISIDNKKICKADKLILSCGIISNIEIAKEAGIKTAKGIIVDQKMKTIISNIFACGDNVESIDIVTKKNTLSPLGSTAIRQAKVVAENICGKVSQFNGVLNTNCSKIGDLIIASCGITEEEALKEQMKIISAKYSTKTKSEYCKSGKDITIKLIADENGKIIGGQIIGYEEVAGRINLIALAITKGLILNDLIESETCYNPCINPIHDPLTITAEICLKKLQKKYGK